MPNTKTVNPPMTETVESAHAAASTLFLGHDGEWWDFWLILSVLVAASAAIAIGVATSGSIISHKREAAAAERALEKYKIDAAKELAKETASVRADADAKIGVAREEAKADVAKSNAVIETARKETADANARALEAKLALEKFRAPRIISQEQSAAITEKVSPFAGQIFDIGLHPSDPEAADLAAQIEEILNRAGWEQIDWKGGDVVYSRPGRKVLGMVTMVGVVAQMEPSKAKEFEAPAVYLMGSLKLAGIQARAEAGNGTAAENKEAMHIIVGQKPR